MLGIDIQSSWTGSESFFRSSSMEMLSGLRINAMRPLRGDRLIVTLTYPD
jgi:hypothetical protein